MKKFEKLRKACAQYPEIQLIPPEIISYLKYNNLHKKEIAEFCGNLKKEEK